MAGSRSCDAASKLRLLVCPIFGFSVGGVPGRVLQNCKKIFSSPRHALQPPLICFLVRFLTQKLRPLITKVPFLPVFAKVGGLPGRISQNSYNIFLCSKTSTNLFADPTTSLCTVGIEKIPQKPKMDIIYEQDCIYIVSL